MALTLGLRPTFSRAFGLIMMLVMFMMMLMMIMRMMIMMMMTTTKDADDDGNAHTQLHRSSGAAGGPPPPPPETYPNVFFRSGAAGDLTKSVQALSLRWSFNEIGAGPQPPLEC